MSGRLLGSLAVGDLRRFLRDRFLVGSLGYVLAVSLLFRWGLPYATEALQARLGFDLAPYHPLVASYVAMMLGALMFGVVGAFLLLETRTERTLEAVRVSPTAVGRFLGLEATLTYLGAVPTIGVAAALIGHGAPGPGAVISCALVGGLTAPVVTLAIGGVAKDQVHAFALLKVVGLLGFLPVLAGLVPEPMRYGALVLPSFAALQAWWSAASGADGWWAWLGVGVLVNGAWIYAAFRWFRG